MRNTSFQNWIVGGLITIFFLWYAIPTVTSTSKDYRMVAAFDADEATHVNLIRNNLTKKDWIIDYDFYGHHYFNMALYPLWIYSYIAPVSDQAIIITLRAIPAFFSWLTVLLIFYCCLKFLDKSSALISTFLICFSYPDFLKNAVNAHPDNVQVFFLVLTFFLAGHYLKNKNLNWLFGASFAAGMAFANKYSGVLAIPILMLLTVFEKKQTTTLKNTLPFSIGYLFMAYFFSSYFMQPYLLENEETQTFLLTSNILSGICTIIGITLAIAPLISKKIMDRFFPVFQSSFLIGLIFLISFGLGSPDSLKELKFTNGILKISAHINAGHWFLNEMNGTDWLFMIFSNNMLAPILALFTIIGIFAISHETFKKQKFTFSVILVIWGFIFMAYLIARVRAPFDHYLLPVIPFVIMLASIGISYVQNWIKANVKYALIINSIGVIIIGYFLYPSFKEVIKLQTYLSDRDTNSGNVLIGNYLAENYPDSMIVLADYYSYVPSNFKKYHPKWGLDSIVANTVNPDIIITTRIAKRYEDINKADFYKGGKDVYINRNRFYKELSEGKLTYKKVKQVDEVILYEKK